MKLTGFYTTQGEKIAAGLLAGKTLSITRITAGTGTTAASASALAQEQQTLGPCLPEVSGNTAIIRCTLSAEEAKAPYALRELGVYAKNSAGKETLYLVFRMDEPVSINPAIRLVLRFNLEQTLSDGAGVEITAPLTGLATLEDLEKKADLAGGQVPYSQTPHLTANKSLYVDAALGDDTNAGTQQAPFKTIQAAIDSLPKNLDGYGVQINVAAGSYQEDIVISGFTGGRFNYSIYISGSGNVDTSRPINSLRIFNNSCSVTVQGLYVTGYSNTSAVLVSGARATFSGLLVKNNSAGEIGILVGGWGGSQALVNTCTVNGFPTAGVQVDQNSVATLNGTTIQKCGVGLQAGSASSGTGGIVMNYQTIYSGNTANTATTRNGQIFGA